MNSWAVSGGLPSLVAVFFAQYFSYLVVAVFLALFLTGKLKGRWSAMFEGLVAAFVAKFGFIELIRLFWHRLRPFLVDGSIVQLVPASGYSFPSGHAAFFFALATVVYMHNKKAGLGFLSAGFLISLGRVLAGVHYLSDVVAGAVLGVLAALVSVWFLRKVKNFSSLK